MTTQIQVKEGSRRKGRYILVIATATLGYGLSLLEPAIRGLKIWAIFLCASFAVWVAVLKLRQRIHEAGWVFPRTDTVLLTAVVVEVWLYLWFSN
jgi:hypothetical protein